MFMKLKTKVVCRHVIESPIDYFTDKINDCITVLTTGFIYSYNVLNVGVLVLEIKPEELGDRGWT